MLHHLVDAQTLNLTSPEDLPRKLTRCVVINENAGDVEVRYIEQRTALGDGIYPRLAHRITQLRRACPQLRAHDVCGNRSGKWGLARAGRQRRTRHGRRGQQHVRAASLVFYLACASIAADDAPGIRKTAS